MNVFGDEDDDEDDNKPVKPLRPKVAGVSVLGNDDEDEGGDFKNRLAAMLMKGPPSQAPRRTQAVP